MRHPCESQDPSLPDQVCIDNLCVSLSLLLKLLLFVVKKPPLPAVLFLLEPFGFHPQLIGTAEPEPRTLALLSQLCHVSFRTHVWTPSNRLEARELRLFRHERV